MDSLLRHIAACNSARLPGARTPFAIGAATVGYIRPDLVQRLAELPEIRAESRRLVLLDPAALPRIARNLADEGLIRYRGEMFDIRADPDGLVLAQVDRGSLPEFGLISVGVHVNGLVRGRDGWSVWVGYRAADRYLDPGKLDHLVAGGVPAGMSPEATLVKEAAEEADIPAEIASRAHPVARIAYAADRGAEGLRRDLVLCYDLELPPEVTPHPADGEVARFELWPLAQALDAVRTTDAFKFNVNLVLIDLFLRHALIPDREAAQLRAALDHPAPGAPGVPVP